jgi:molybdenum cofactor guanylyltransferase
MEQVHAPVPRFPDCTGVLVAGGAASRLGGIPKGLLRVSGEPIAARTLRLFGELFARSLIVANDAAPYAGFGVPVVPDVIAGKGAPGGLHAALRASTTPWVFTAACDMPFLASDPVAWLADRRSGVPAVAVIWGGRLEPLHAFWSRDCLPVLEEALRTGDPSMWALATSVGARFVGEQEWREVDPDGRAFANVNTPADAARLGAAHPHGIAG